MPDRVRIIDSHTEGEPTRLVLDVPDLLGNTLAEKAADFNTNHSGFWTGILLEPRGSEVLVGALLLQPSKPGTTAGVIFFNNVGVLGMCGHGTIGLVASLAYLGKLEIGDHVIETPVGDVFARLNDDGSVTVRNVLSYRYKTDVSLTYSAQPPINGDIAYGGNWFFLVKNSPLPIEPWAMRGLLALSQLIKKALKAQSITGANGAEIDHIEVFGPPTRPDADSKNFVLCPGNAYDRSPCGTGTSAKLACLAADGKLAPGEIWRQESIIGTMFEASYELAEGGILPTITGRAYVTGESTLVFDENDPFRAGIQL